MGDLNDFFAKRDGRGPRRYRDYTIREVLEETQASSIDNLAANVQRHCVLNDAKKDTETLSTGIGSYQRDEEVKLNRFQKKTKAILDDLQIKSQRPSGFDSAGDDRYECEWPPWLPRAGFPNKAAPFNQEYTGITADYMTSSGRKANRNLDEDSRRGSDQSYRPHLGGRRDSCSPEDDRCSAMAKSRRPMAGRSSCLGKRAETGWSSGSGASAGRSGASARSYSSEAYGSSSGPRRTDTPRPNANSLPRNRDGDSEGGSSSHGASRESGAVNRPTLWGSGGFYRPPMRGLGEVCPPKENSKELAQRSVGGKKHWASGGEPGGSDRRSSQEDDLEMAVRFTDNRSARKRTVVLRERGSGASASEVGCVESENGASSSGLSNAPVSQAVCSLRNADGDSNASSSSDATRRGSGAVNRLAQSGGVGFYRPPKRGLGEVCPPKEDANEVALGRTGGRSSLLGRKTDDMPAIVGPGGSDRRSSSGSIGAYVPPSMKTANGSRGP